MLANRAHHSNALSPVPTQWILDWLIFGRPSLLIAEPQVKRSFVEIDQRLPRRNHFREADPEVLDGGGILR